MNKKDMDFFLRKTGVLSLEEFIEGASNEIYFDNVGLRFQFESLEEAFPTAEKSELIDILTAIIKRVIEKGGVIIKDNSCAEGGAIIDKYVDIHSEAFARALAEFAANNPDYGGSVWGGIWFYSDVDCIERLSNEIFYTDVSLYGVLDVLKDKDRFSVTEKVEQIDKLTAIIKRIIEKGGVVVRDHLQAEGAAIISRHADIHTEIFARELAEFMVNNPDYRGIWFYEEEDCVELLSTEVLRNPLYLHAALETLKKRFLITDRSEQLDVLTAVIKKTVEIGGEIIKDYGEIIKDYSKSAAVAVIMNQYTDIHSEAFARALADFMVNHPDYGSDGRGYGICFLSKYK